MERPKFTREFKLEAVRLIKERGVSYAQASLDLGVHQSQLRPTSRRNRREVRFHCEAPGDLAGAMVVRGARCLAGWVLCLADTTTQSAQPE